MLSIYYHKTQLLLRLLHTSQRVQQTPKQMSLPNQLRSVVVTAGGSTTRMSLNNNTTTNTNNNNDNDSISNKDSDLINLDSEDLTQLADFCAVSKELLQRVATVDTIQPILLDILKAK